jgi:hypothetical protein
MRGGWNRGEQSRASQRDRVTESQGHRGSQARERPQRQTRISGCIPFEFCNSFWYQVPHANAEHPAHTTITFYST